ncbi:OLC1v1026571C1 [Oldenlandia corymbosa var. corymbosa]|uniref:OLC1v1026571C1 n=1 Tax=Oldenlandia corymbosa var. corymbosa TaxID=529605 RepID=A0AAV1C9D2_OLDCO|nr:OLC1v1026571C1 [Oldenlandia corymbosa var. corymbosa]
MATVPSSSTLPLSSPNPLAFLTSSSASSRTPTFLKLHAPPLRNLSIPRAASDDSDNNEAESPSDSDSDDFDSRLSQIRLRYKSGQGKKAEVRKTRKGAPGTSGSGSSLYLPPVQLKEPVSEGLTVEFGFSPYSERANGRIALVGLTALVLVELATGQGVIKYHSPAIVFIQIYFMAAASALYIKYEKEKVSVWPQTPVSSPSSSQK